MERLKIIAVDFDGTLCTNSYPKIGEANIRLISILKTLQKNGCQLILWTCRCGSLLEDAVKWCSKFQLYFDAVNENLQEIVTKLSDLMNSFWIYIVLALGAVVVVWG
ncbi:MAG: hypothetical protein BHW44_00325, partial [Roseburia sp. 40_7]